MAVAREVLAGLWPFLHTPGNWISWRVFSLDRLEGFLSVRFHFQQTLGRLKSLMKTRVCNGKTSPNYL